MKIDNTVAECFVYTEREGALSPIGHDLKLEVTRFTMNAEDRAITAFFDADSLRVVGAMKEGLLDTSELSDKDRAKIENNIVKDVLSARKHAKIKFESSEVKRDADAVTIRGELTIAGKRAPIALTMRHTLDEWVGKITLRQSTWGIEPYKAFLGQLRIKDEIEVELRIPAAHFESIDL